jgi:hypothetical protein
MGTFGCALNFYATTEQEHRAQGTDQVLDGIHVATIRMSPEFIKGMVFYLYKRVRQYEQDGPINLSETTLQRLTEGDRAGWDRLWAQNQ